MTDFTTISLGISTASDLSEFLPLLVWLQFTKKQQPWSVLGIFFLISSFIKLYTLITAEMGIHNMPAFHILAFWEIVMLFVYYSKLVFKKVYIAGIAILLLLNAGSLFFQDLDTFNSYAWAINIMILIIMGILYLFKLYNTEDYTPLEMRPDFIITSGWLIYASGSLFAYLMGTEILSGEPEGFFHNAWIFQCVSNLSKNIIVSYGLWLAK